MRALRRGQSGITLVELVISLVVIGIAAAAVLGVYTTTIRASADPMIRAQAIAIAEMYMDEIMGRRYSTTTGSGSCTASRAAWEEIGDYDGLTDCQPRDVFGEFMDGLDNYRVTVTVAGDTDLGGIGERRIDVQVRDTASTVNITISAWRTP